MIGVIADPAEADVVREFFELFKTPWEFYRRDERYDVLLCAGDRPFEGDAKLVVFTPEEKRVGTTNRILKPPSLQAMRINLSYGQSSAPDLRGHNYFRWSGESRC